MQKRKSVPGQMVIDSNDSDAVRWEPENAGNELHPICTKSKRYLRKTNMDKRENLAIESFWKETLKADSLLLWIVVNIRPA